jgi:hypothetical protein
MPNFQGKSMQQVAEVPEGTERDIPADLLFSQEGYRK